MKQTQYKEFIERLSAHRAQAERRKAEIISAIKALSSTDRTQAMLNYIAAADFSRNKEVIFGDNSLSECNFLFSVAKEIPNVNLAEIYNAMPKAAQANIRLLYKYNPNK